MKMSTCSGLPTHPLEIDRLTFDSGSTGAKHTIGSRVPSTRDERIRVQSINS
jgi:hypothetical protein